MRSSKNKKSKSKTGIRYRNANANKHEESWNSSTERFSHLGSTSYYRPSYPVSTPRRFSIASGQKQSNLFDQSTFVSTLPPLKTSNDPPLHLAYPENAFVPKRHKAKILVWSDLTVDAIDRLNESLNPEYIKNVLADIFYLDNWKENSKAGIVLDLYYHTLQFARDKNFSKEKTSTFFSIIKEIFQVCIETPFGNLDHTFLYFKDLLHCHSVNHPPYSIELFTPSEVRKISEYTVNTFFRHFKMYKYAFTAQIRLDINLSYEGMPTPSQSEEDTIETKSPFPETEEPSELEKEVQDEDVAKAKEDLRNLVMSILTEEAKKIEGKVEDQVHAAVEVLNSKIDPYINAPGKQEGKGKKK
ncbi:coiled-coil domain-containing protein isoform X1 [Biomphalaria glabrata]|nr:putative coiled-coil domain-containing protein C16orf93 isoform X1 [Biomphalaria glabrata]